MQLISRISSFSLPDPSLDVGSSTALPAAMNSSRRRPPAFSSSNFSTFDVNSIWRHQQINQIEQILLKKSEARSPTEIAYYVKYFSELKYFRELVQLTDPDIVKPLTKHSRILKVKKGEMVFDKGDPIHHFYVLLHGKVGLVFGNTPADEAQRVEGALSLLVNGFFETQLKSPRRKQRKQPVKKQQIVQKQEHDIEPIFKKWQVPLEETQINTLINQEQSFGDESQHVHAHRKLYAIALEHSQLLEIPYASFFKTLKVSHEKRMERQKQFFRKFKCFDMLQDEELSVLIQTSKFIDGLKNQYVFKEGQRSDCFYLMYEGEVMLTKSAKLESDTPNPVYLTRKNWLNRQKQQTPLPYSDFQKLFTFRPKQESVELCLIERENIFGEEQSFLRTPRQTAARIFSSTVKYYAVEVKELEAILKEKKYELKDFKDFLFANTTRKKMAYRQEKFAHVLSLRNKARVDSMFADTAYSNSIEDAAATPTTAGGGFDSPRKYKIQKLSKKPSTPRDDPGQFSPMGDMGGLDEQTNPFVSFSNIEKQMQASSILSKIRNPKKRDINLNEPLFEPTYFSSLQKEYRRIDNQYRKRRFSIKSTAGSPLKSSRIKNKQS